MSEILSADVVKALVEHIGAVGYSYTAGEYPDAEFKLLAHDAALRAENEKLREALPSDEDECPCCLTHSCEAFRAYVSRARDAEGEGKNNG